MVDRSLLPPPRLPFLFLALFLLPTVVHADISAFADCGSKTDKFCKKDEFTGIANSVGGDNTEIYHLEPLFNYHRVKVPNKNTATAVLNRAILFTAKVATVTVIFGATGMDKCGLVVVTSSTSTTRESGKTKKEDFKSYTYNIAKKDKSDNSGASNIAYKENTAVLDVPPDGDMFTLATYDPQCELIVNINGIAGVYYVYPRGIFYENYFHSGNSDTEFGGGGKTPIFEYPTTTIENKVETMIAHPFSKNHGYFNVYKGMFETEALKTACYDQCRFARKINYEMSQNTQFSMRIIATEKCKWIKIVLNKERTILDAEINLRNSYVIKPTAIRASSLVTRLSTHAEKEVTKEIDTLITQTFKAGPSETVMDYTLSKSKVYRPAYEVRVHFQMKTVSSTALNSTFAFHIMDRENTRVSANMVEHPSDVQLYFDHPACLYTPITNVKGLPTLANTGTRHIKEGDNSNEADAKEPHYFKPAKRDTGKDEGNAETARNGKHDREDNSTVTPNQNRIQLQEQFNNIYQKWQEWVRIREEERKKTPAWRIWSVAAGYSSGVLITFIFASAIACIFRRSLYTFWYKEMYRRYGTDTTDATGIGKTEAGTTIGDTVTGTTVGDTIGATSTMTTATTVG